MNWLNEFVNDYFTKLPRVSLIDFVEIAILAFMVYHILMWIKNTRAWMLLKGFAVILLFVFVASIFEMDTILWLASKTFNVGITAVIIVFQPELRKALEQLGQKNLLTSILPIETSKEGSERFSDKTINEIIKATYEMGKVKTGALIVIEQNVELREFERTGIEVDALLTSQLLINIFEHNTPLHDGAVIVKGNRVVSATCYLPLSDNMELSKDLGTRHRAGVGISEVTDSMTIIVSEETGNVSAAIGGRLIRNINSDLLREKLVLLQNKSIDTKKFRLWKGRLKHENKSNS